MSSSNAAKRALDDEQVEEENGHDAKRIKTEQPAETIADHVQEDGSDDDDKPVLPTGGTSASRKARTGAECPYLDSVSRQNLDFDFEKCCSVSLSPTNVYVCLVCGKYFQGRGPKTNAYTHALETAHHMYMKLEDGKVYCLPDLYEVIDRSLDDIRYVLSPSFTSKDIATLDTNVSWTRALDGTEYMPGLVGLNNMKANDYANVAIQVLTRMGPLRDFFLQPSNYAQCRSLMVQRFGELLRKIWNPRNFKGQVSPHEFMQAVMQASSKRFIIDGQSDPIDFLTWLLNELHLQLTGGKRKGKSIITACFQGELQVTTEAGTGKASQSNEDITERVPFLMLALNLPAAPLYKDALEKNIIPQVPIFDILKKYDGEYVTDQVRTGRQRFRITKLPRFLVLHIKRFTKNNFFLEKNPTIVNFPVKNLDLGAMLPVPTGANGQPVPSKYNLVANVVHDGKAGGGTYKCHIHRAVEDAWYELEDLHVVDVLPQMVALSETYLQVYQQQDMPPLDLTKLRR